MRLFPYLPNKAASRVMTLAPPFDLVTVFGPHCVCPGDVYLIGAAAGQVFAPGTGGDDDGYAIIGEVYAMGAVAGQVFAPGIGVEEDGYSIMGEVYVPGAQAGQMGCEC